jgi:hypothetical protein
LFASLNARRRKRRQQRRRFLSRGGVPQLQIVSRTSQLFESASTSVSVTLPTRLVGDRMILLLNRSSSSADAIATPSGWTAMADTLFSGSVAGTDANFCRSYYRDVTAGSVGDSTADFTGGDSTLSTSFIWLLRGVDPSKAPVGNANRFNSNTAGLQSVDPPLLTPAYGALTYAWLAYLGVAMQDLTLGTSDSVTVFPSGYGNTGTETTHHVTAATGCAQGHGDKIAKAASDDPSAWSYNPNQGNRALSITIAVAGYG